MLAAVSPETASSPRRCRVPPESHRCQHARRHGRAGGTPGRSRAVVNRHPEINHNYEREHPFNLWLVATAANAAHLDRVLA